MAEIPITKTAKEIQKAQSREINLVVFFSNLFFLALIVIGWCALNDVKYLGYFDFYELINSVERSFEFSDILNGAPLLITYHVAAPSLAPAAIDATPFAVMSALLFFALLIVECITVAIVEAFSLNKLNNQLKPLYRVAEAAKKLDNEDYSVAEKRAINPTYDESESIHTLESAIDSIKPDRLDAELHTGDKDLMGLENSINSLLTRTRDSYSQQIRFVSDASHELRTPIAVIKGYTDMLDRWGKQDEKVLEESIAAIKSETEHMNKLVEQLLFLARGDSGRNRLTIERFSLSDMIKEVYDESVMIDPSHEWRLFADYPVFVCGDVAMLKQATRILVDNAAKYTPQGETITLKAIYDKDKAPLVIVQDNGVGIKQSDLAHVFERFYRSDEARGKKQGGTGLGLAIAKWIVDRHDGYFELLSREDFGTRITIHLPKSLPLSQSEKPVDAK